MKNILIFFAFTILLLSCETAKVEDIPTTETSSLEPNTVQTPVAEIPTLETITEVDTIEMPTDDITDDTIIEDSIQEQETLSETGEADVGFIDDALPVLVDEEEIILDDFTSSLALNEEEEKDVFDELELESDSLEQADLIADNSVLTDSDTEIVVITEEKETPSTTVSVLESEDNIEEPSFIDDTKIVQDDAEALLGETIFVDEMTQTMPLIALTEAIVTADTVDTPLPSITEGNETGNVDSIQDVADADITSDVRSPTDTTLTEEPQNDFLENTLIEDADTTLESLAAVETVPPVIQDQNIVDSTGVDQITLVEQPDFIEQSSSENIIIQDVAPTIDDEDIMDTLVVDDSSMQDTIVLRDDGTMLDAIDSPTEQISSTSDVEMSTEPPVISDVTELLNNPVFSDALDIEKDIEPSQKVELYEGDYADIFLPGQGWIYLGEVKESKPSVLDFYARYIDGNDTLFNFYAANTGKTILHFYKQDILANTYLDEYVEVTVKRLTVRNNGSSQSTSKTEELYGISAEPEVQIIGGQSSTIEFDNGDYEIEGEFVPENILDDAQIAFDEGRFADSISLLDEYTSLGVDKIDRALYLYGQNYESNSEVKNIRLALSSYQKIIDSFPNSEYWDASAKRKVYIERFYVNIR